MTKSLNHFFLLVVLLFLSALIFLFDYFFKLLWLRAWPEKGINLAKSQLKAGVEKLIPPKAINLDPVILQNKVEYLEKEKARLEIELVQLRQENEILKKESNISFNLPGSSLLANNLGVIGGVMILDKGESDGVRAGMVVLAEGVLVGRITSVSLYSSRVKLPIFENNEIKVKILPEEEKGVLRGTAEGRLLLEKVLQKTNLVKDQLVVTSGEEEIYPANIPLGRVEKIVSEDVEIYKRAEVKPLLDYQNLKMVKIRL